MAVSKINPTPPPISGPCENCKKVATQRCARCKLVFYCGKECQEKVWSEHKLVCLTPEARQQRTKTILEENEQLMKSSEFRHNLEAGGLATQLSEFRQIEMEIRQLMEASPDKKILLQLIDKVFPKERCERKLRLSWKKLPPDEQQNRSQKYQEILQKFQKLEELKSKGKEPHSVVMPIQIIREGAKAIVNMPVHPNSSVDRASVRTAANTVLETLALIEASPDFEMITTYASRAVSSLVLQADLKLRWMQLPQQESARRNEAWQKMAPRYEPFVQAVMLLQNQAYNHFMSKP
ncbi:MAG: zinc finger MYND domain-containing protein [Verrucomicrobia bacterium]|nr:zinc finger MYND domain-containing protein [Verrucomicrobiota bacterium]